MTGPFVDSSAATARLPSDDLREDLVEPQNAGDLAVHVAQSAK
jgi:hypothetical protein